MVVHVCVVSMGMYCTVHVVCSHDDHMRIYVQIPYLTVKTAANITLYSEGFMNGFIWVISIPSSAAENWSI